MLLRDILKAGDAAHLPANHGARAFSADRHRAEARGNRAVSIRTGLHRGKAGDPFFAAFLVSTLCGTRPGRSRGGKCAALSACSHQNNAELLHIYFGHIAVHLQPLMRHWQKPCVVSFHGADVLVDLDKPHYRSATRKMLGGRAAVLVRSQSLARAVEALGCPATKIRVHRTGIPLKEIAFQVRSRPNDGAWRFLQAGRLIEKKGFRQASRVCRLPEKEPERDIYDRRRRTVARGSAKSRA